MLFVDAVQLLCSLALDTLAPRQCAVCRRAAGLQAFCPDCLRHFEHNTRNQPQATTLGGLSVVALGGFEAPLSDAIKLFKYSGRSDLAAPLAKLWWRGCQHAFTRGAPVTLVPVPLHPGRLVTRGYNQSALLASHLAKLTGYQHAPVLLEKIRETKTQAGLSALERARNLDQALRVASKACRLPHQNIVLVDDVVTTGATVNACARAAARAGLKVLAVWALALTRNPRDASVD